MQCIVRGTAFAAALALVSTTLPAQGPTKEPLIRRNSLYVEVGGNAGDGSVNYERLVGPRTLVRVGYGAGSASYGMCLGMGFVSACEGEVELTLIPMMVSRLIGTTHMAELGAGVAVGRITDRYRSAFGEEGSIQSEESMSLVTATIGYRWQGSGRMLVRAGYTPSYQMSGDNPAYPNGFFSAAGVSLGVAF
jgi:hypothetical protein